MRLKIGIIFLVLFFCLLTPYVTEAKVSIVGGLTHEKSARIGEIYQGVIFLRNIGKEPQEVKVYQTDYLFFFDGRNIYGEPGKDTRSNADWISFSPHWLTIPPEGISAVNYAVKVPEDETLVGTYWSMFMVEEGISKSPPEAGETEKDKIRLGIRQVMRYGIQMVAHIGDSGDYKLKFLEAKLLKEKGNRFLQVDMESTGERLLKPFLWAELYDANGNYIGKFEGGRLRIYPGTSVRYRVDLSGVPKGKYKALVIADCGGDCVFGITYNLRFEK